MSRRIIFTPSVDLKDELATTGILITCYDRTGKEVKRVTSTSGEVEDPDSGGSGTDSETENGNGSGSNDDNNTDAPPIINPDLDHPSDGD